MAKMGRPPKVETEKRSARLEIRVTEDEREAMTASAEAQGTPLSEWLRSAAMSKLAKEK